jgi:hypothetical protein
VSDAFLSPNDQMEALSRAYVAAIAAKAGYAMSETNFDRDSVDVTLQAREQMRPQIGLQLKSTMRVPLKATAFAFPLPIKNYNDLRVRTQVPRILVVLALSANADKWIDHRAERLIIRRCAYWKSLLGSPDTQNYTSIAITIDTKHIFDVPTLISLMQKSRNGVPL